MHKLSQRSRSDARTSLISVLLLVLLSSLACTDPPMDEPDADVAPEDLDAQDMSTSARVRLRSCQGGASLPVRPLEPWRGLTSGVTARGEPSHALHDVVTTRDRDVDFFGHATYGLFERELAGEVVDLYIHDCAQGFSLLSRGITTRRGEVRFVIAQQDVPFHGEYDLVMRVVGDGSFTRATLRVLPAGTRFVVLDVDEVLTSDRLGGFQDRVADFFKPVGVGDYIPTPRQGAVAMTQLRAAQGYELLYLTPRPHDLAGESARWLTSQGFAPGTLWFADDTEASLSWNVKAYKYGVLERILQRGYNLDAAYATSAQDVEAYRQAGLEDARIFVVGNEAMEGSITRLGENYEAHVRALSVEAPVEQPFERQER